VRSQALSTSCSRRSDLPATSQMVLNQTLLITLNSLTGHPPLCTQLPEVVGVVMA
jgi:hypothetical protein